MVLKLVSVAILAAVLGSASVQAQSVRQIGGPANAPPSGFTGQQFVDNRGCVFLKAGYGGQSAWVPRVGRDRKAMCGFPPTGTGRSNIEVATAEEMAKPLAPVIEAIPVVRAAPVVQAARPTVLAAIEPVIPVVRAPTVLAAPVVQARPVYVPTAPIIAPVVAAAPVVRQPAPYVQTAPRATYEAVAASGPGRGQVGCYASAPVAERVKLRNGGTAVVCTRGDGSLTGWRPPVYARNAGVGASLTDPVVASNTGTKSRGVAHGNAGSNSGDETTYAAARTQKVPTPPKGYKVAWDDDRLNPNRGKGTLAGWQDQEQVWTHDVPAKLVADVPANKRKKKVVYVQKGSQVVVSTKGQAATAPVQKKQASKKAVGKGGAYIQVGTFGVPANADGAASRLQNAGLPVARSKISSGGKAMQIVLAGPFSTAEDAQVALSMARRAGFGDAFIR